METILTQRNSIANHFLAELRDTEIQKIECALGKI